MHYRVLIAPYRFRCPICGTVTPKGESYVEKDDATFCVKCGLPERRLRPLNNSK